MKMFIFLEDLNPEEVSRKFKKGSYDKNIT